MSKITSSKILVKNFFSVFQYIHASTFRVWKSQFLSSAPSFASHWTVSWITAKKKFFHVSLTVFSQKNETINKTVSLNSAVSYYFTCFEKLNADDENCRIQTGKMLYVLQIKTKTFREGSSDHLLSVDVKILLKPWSKYRRKWSLIFGSLDSKNLPDFSR